MMLISSKFNICLEIQATMHQSYYLFRGVSVWAVNFFLPFHNYAQFGVHLSQQIDSNTLTFTKCSCFPTINKE